MATHVLIVDDSLVERLLVEGLLSKVPGYRVTLAENGREALQRIQDSAPDVIVTDLVMPEMDGLELVRESRRRRPEIPIILLTAHGDESTAAAALDAGAASYVPKSRRAERLVDTVRRVAENAAADRRRERLGQSMLQFHCRWSLDNDPQLIRALVEQVQQSMAGIGFLDTVGRIRTGEALEEALLNAMYHGNLEINEKELARVRGELDDGLIQRLIQERCRDPEIGQRKILVVAHVTADEARFVIRDQGRGFSVAFVSDDTGAFEDGRRRGMTLMRSLMDEVSYNDAGNELKMTKRAAAQKELARQPR